MEELFPDHRHQNQILLKFTQIAKSVIVSSTDNYRVDNE